jgi:hypothetical protein
VDVGVVGPFVERIASHPASSTPASGIATTAQADLDRAMPRD